MSGRSVKLQRAIDHLVGVVMELREADKGEDTGLTLGSLIERERAAWGLSLQDLADRCDLSKAHVWEMAQDRSINPTATVIGRLADALKVPPVQVLNAALASQIVCTTSTSRGSR